jgi:hypothetical protein
MWKLCVYLSRLLGLILGTEGTCLDPWSMTWQLPDATATDLDLSSSHHIINYQFSNNSNCLLSYQHSIKSGYNSGFFVRVTVYQLLKDHWIYFTRVSVLDTLYQTKSRNKDLRKVTAILTQSKSKNFFIGGIFEAKPMMHRLLMFKVLLLFYNRICW